MKKSKTYNEKAAKNHLIQLIHKTRNWDNFELDDKGRLVLFSDLYMWDDFSIHNVPEEGNKKEDEEVYEEFTLPEISPK